MPLDERPSPMNAMSNTNTNRLQSDPLNDIVKKLAGTVAKVSKLRQFLGDLESELNDIYQECENELSARTVVVVSTADKGQIIVERNNLDAMKQTTHSRLAGKPGPISLLEGHGRKPDSKFKLRKSETKGRSLSSTGDPSLPVVSRGSKLPPGRGRNWLGFMSILRSWSRTVAAPKHAERPSVPQPPHPFPFPGVIDFSTYPPELKRQGYGWFILFNPSPKVKRMLDVNLVHEIMHHSGVYSVRFSRDEKRIATACDKVVQVYNVKAGFEVCCLYHGSDVVIRSVCFSPDGKYLATGAEDDKVRVWNIANTQCEQILEGHQGTVESVDFSSNGRFIVSGSFDGTVRVWDANDWTSNVLTIDDHYLPNHGHAVCSVASSPDGRYVSAGSIDNVVRIWEMTTGVLVQRLRGHQDVVHSVNFTPDGTGLVSASWDGTLKYWDVSGLGIGLGVTSTALTGNSSASSNPSSPCLMNLMDHSLRCAVGTTGSVSHNGVWAASGSVDGKVLFWDIRTGVAQCMLLGHKTGVYGVDLSLSGNLLATASDDGEVRIWTMEQLPFVISAR